MLPNLLDDLLKAWDAKAAAMPPPPAPPPPSAPEPIVAEDPLAADDAVGRGETVSAAEEIEQAFGAGEVAEESVIVTAETSPLDAGPAEIVVESTEAAMPSFESQPRVEETADELRVVWDEHVVAAEPLPVDAGEAIVGGDPELADHQPGPVNEVVEEVPGPEAIQAVMEQTANDAPPALAPETKPFQLAFTPPFALPASPMDSLLSSLLASYDVSSVPPAHQDQEQSVAELLEESSESTAVEEPEAEIKPVAAEAPVPPPPVVVIAPPQPLPVLDEPEPVVVSPPEPEPAFRLRTPVFQNLSQLGRNLAATTTTKHVAVALGSQKFAVAVENVLEAGRYPKTTYVSGLPGHVLGVFSFRGEVIPVIDVRTLAGISEESNPADSRILTVQSRAKTGKAAFVFDSLEGIVNLDVDASISVIPGFPLAQMLAGVNQDGASQFGMINVDRMLELAGCLEDDEAAA